MATYQSMTMVFAGLAIHNRRMAPGTLNYASAHENKQEEKALKELRLDGSVVLKIVKHCQESQPFLVTGQLLGLDIGSSLEVTDCFPFPVSHLSWPTLSLQEYHLAML